MLIYKTKHVMDNFYFYKTTNLLNGMFYYGSGQHKNYYGSGKVLQRAITKYGLSNFKVEILKRFSDRKTAYEFEERFLRLYKISTLKNSYNIKDRAWGGDVFTNNPDKEAYRKSLSVAQTKRYADPNERIKANPFHNASPERTNELKKIWSECKSGSKNGRYKHNSKVLQLDKDGNLIKIHNDAISTRNDGFTPKYVLRCIKGTLKSHGGFLWKNEN
jgi:hypothetical protein